MSITAAMRQAIYAVSISVFLFLSGCSIPNLEGQQCTEARDAVHDFYFWYLGTDPAMRDKQKDVYDRFIAPGFVTAAGEGRDPFFLSDTIPTTLKIGKCEMKDDSRVEMQVQLYWRQGGKTDQKEVYADVARSGDKWLIDKVESR
jgi:hypothetical protein